MREIQGIIATQIQSFVVRSKTNEPIKIKLRYMPIIRRWFMDIEYKQFKLNEYKIYVTDNLLWNWRNILPFGIMCFCRKGEPFLINDFESGRVSLIIIDKD